MKKHFLAIIVLLVACQLVNGQYRKQKDKDSANNTYNQAFLINPLNFFVGGFEIGYEKIKNTKSYKLFGGYYFLDNPSFYEDPDPVISDKYANLEGFRLEFQYLHIKPVKNDFRYYGGAYAVAKGMSMDVSRTAAGSSSTVTTDYTARAFSGSLGVIAGVRTYIYENIFMDAFIGGGITFPFSGSFIDDIHIDVVNPFKRSINPRAGFSVGIAF